MKTCPVLLIAVALCALPLVRLAAQDVTVGEPQWFFPEPAPEVMPKAKRKLKPDYPDEMWKLGEVGYVVLARHIDLKGKNFTVSFESTHLPFRRAVEAEMQSWEISGAKRGGQPVVALVWVPVIFNPKSAAVKGAEATPRLLSVGPVVTKERVGLAGQPPVVRMKLSLDATGAITRAEPEGEVKETVLASIRDGLKIWKFAPARVGGQAVAAEVTVSVICQRPVPADVALRSPAKVIKQVPPEFPPALQGTGLKGEVLLDIEVDPEGNVKSPTIVSSTHPGFNESAVAALLQWKFQPATRDGKPVKDRIRVPMIITASDRGRGESETYKVESRTDQSKLPENLRFDTPAKIIGALVPVYPYSLRRDGVKGTAKGTMLIDPRGRVIAVKIKATDRPELGAALAAALDGFTFDPALKDGKPVAHLLNYEQRFEENAFLDDGSRDLLDVERKHPERIVGAGKLDAPLKPISQRAPVSPTAWPKDVTQAEALVEFLVDNEGHVRLPRIVSATADSFGYAAAQAVVAWQFGPPLVGGKPAVVRVKVPFKFALNNAKAPAAQ